MKSDHVVVTAIEPAEYYRRRVTLRNTKTGAEYTLYYGDSVSEATIRMRAPFLAAKYNGR
ncbi:hypothetical protein [Paenibacillus aceti]|uniref:Uncharacterized protein n=1 Tax=Paenibacillus aceti TaxID=1820010 RepID=A0ABQ1W1F5_9BACL|nr:hypothetical protein [Paenibacillus aceti]GGG08646.1 hypothetical protein GCM10010913_33020 [Paenibacillus aceti]